MVNLRALHPGDAQALTRVYSGASVWHTTGRALTFEQAQDKIRTALARAAETPRAQWSWGIRAEDEMIGLIALRRRAPTMGTISYILREDTWGNGYATDAAQQAVAFAFTTAGLDRLEAMHHPANPASGRVLAKTGFTRTGTHEGQAVDGSTVSYVVYTLQPPATPSADRC
ncbi:GNAT family N-acetyltransferase [Streptomyces sp. NPDC058866]|uniref:GNAT family N-acetyltransferase n=1 Tax=unclassified Streptomyces TaxID=2593676 RepID=UPI0036A0C02A